MTKTELRELWWEVVEARNALYRKYPGYRWKQPEKGEGSRSDESKAWTEAGVEFEKANACKGYWEEWGVAINGKKYTYEEPL